MNAQALISSAMRLIGVLASGELPSAAEQNDALMILNQMLDSWSIERLAIFSIQRNVQVPAALKQVYTLGANGDFNIARPPRLDRVSVISLNNPDQPLELPMEMLGDVGWNAIPVKNISGSLPMKCWNDKSYPLMNLSMWPVPTVQINFALYLWAALAQFPDLVTDEEFPPGYLKALRYNLALDLAPEFGRQIDPAVAAQAIASKAAIKSINAVAPQMAVDPAIAGNGNQRIYNWLTDGPAGGGS